MIGISKKLHKIIQRKRISVRDIEGFKITGVEITEVITKAITALKVVGFSKRNLASNSFNSQSETSVSKNASIEMDGNVF